jgi:hypothetical protein
MLPKGPIGKLMPTPVLMLAQPEAKTARPKTIEADVMARIVCDFIVNPF